MSHHHEVDTSKGIQFAFWLNLCFSIIEIVGGLYTNSTAILADAFHDFMDVIAIGLAVLLERYARKQNDQQYSFGYRRFSVLSAVFISMILVFGSLVMVQAAIHSFGEPKPIHSQGMFILAIIGIIANGLAFIRIKKESKELAHDHSGHHHETSHGHTHHHNPNSQAIMLHLLEDVLGWVAVLVGSIILYFTNWLWIDGVLTLGIASFILFNAIKNLRRTGRILLQAVPEGIPYEEIQNKILAIEGVAALEQFRIWSLDGSKQVSSGHVVVQKEIDSANVIAQVESLLQSYQINEITLQTKVALS